MTVNMEPHDRPDKPSHWQSIPLVFQPPSTGTKVPFDTRCPEGRVRSTPLPIRVVVLSDAAPDRNGVGSYYADLVEQLCEHIESAALFHPDNQASPGYRYLSAPLPGDRTQRVCIPRPAYLWRAICRERPTAIIVPTPGPFGLAGIYIARKLQIPLIVGFHTDYEALASLYWQNHFGFVCQRYLNWCNRLLFRHGAAVLANSPTMLEQAKRCGATHTSLMGTSIPDNFVRKAAYGLNANIERVLFAGRLADEKNLPDVVNAAQEHPHIQFTIAGDGPLRRWVESKSEQIPNLDYRGWVKRSELMNLMDQHDLLMLPSKVESFGTVALEAMARGRLVMVSASCGIIDWPLLRNTLVVVADDETPSEALSHLCKLSCEARQTLASLARQRARALNQWNVRSWINTLQKVQATDNSTMH